jgi:signal peptidase II
LKSPAARFGWVWTALGVFVVDRATKAAVENHTQIGYRHIVIPGFFDFVHAANPGVAFGLFADTPSRGITAALSLATVLVCAMLIWLLVTARAGAALATLGISLILGGALGNLYDRLLHARVTDFLYFHLGSHYWPAFNVADAAITVGTVLVGIELIFLSKSPHHSEELASQGTEPQPPR